VLAVRSSRARHASGLFVHGSMGVDLRHAFNTVSANGVTGISASRRVDSRHDDGHVAFSLPSLRGGCCCAWLNGPYTDQRMMSLFVDRSFMSA